MLPLAVQTAEVFTASPEDIRFPPAATGGQGPVAAAAGVEILGKSTAKVAAGTLKTAATKGATVTMGRGGAGALQRQVVLVGAGQAHLDVLRLWGLRKQREATADKTTPCSSAAGAASTDKTAAVVLRSILGKDAAVAADEECSNNSGCINNLPVSSVSLLLVTETTEVLYSAMVPGESCWCSC